MSRFFVSGVKRSHKSSLAVFRIMSVMAAIFFIVNIVFLCLISGIFCQRLVNYDLFFTFFPILFSVYVQYDVQCFDLLFSSLDFSVCLIFFLYVLNFLQRN